MPEQVRIGVVGCGFFSRNHLNSWKDLAGQGAELVAVCDLEPAKAEATAKAFNVPRWYSDAAAMLEAEKLDLIDIITRMDTHLPLVRMAASHGVAMIVQKPFAPEWKDCVAIVETAEQAGLWLAVHENFRFQTPLQKVRSVIDSGAIGEPSWARISFRTGFDIYTGQPYFFDERRFAILDLGVHVVDIARYFLGEIAQVSCETQRRNPKVKGEDTVTMLLRHVSGAVSTVECTYESRRIPDTFPETLVEIEGPLGAIATRPGYRIEVTTGGAMVAEEIPIPMLAWAAKPWHMVEESVEKTCAHLLARFKAGQPADTSGRDNLKTFAACEAAYESAATGRAVKPLA